MRIMLIGLAILGTVLALAVGWATGRTPAASLTVTRVSGERPLQMLPNPNEAPQASLDAFAEALGPSPAPPKATVEGAPPKPAPPPEPDVAGIFRRQLTAVVEQDGKVAVLLADEGPSRMLKVGQPFMAGWKLQGVSAGQAVLVRGRERKTISLFEPAGAAPAPPPQAPATPQTDAPGAPMAHNDWVGTREASA